MSATSQLRYDVRISGLLPANDAPLPDGERPHWSPLSHTLVHGPTEAVVVDPPITVAQTAALADWVESFGRRLAYSYITHWHADHWLGAGQRVDSRPGVVLPGLFTSPPGAVGHRHASEAPAGDRVRACVRAGRAGRPSS